MLKIPKKYSGVVMGGMLSIIMGLIVSFVVTATNVGFTEDFLKRWMIAYLATLPIAFPVALIITPIVKGFIDQITE
jgi:hypothetical protein